MVIKRLKEINSKNIKEANLEYSAYIVENCIGLLKEYLTNNSNYSNKENFTGEVFDSYIALYEISHILNEYKKGYFKNERE